ncbi:Reticulocyte-binding protein 2 a [Orchesella cincta]|uniref:Reticulocyte-binding protein 2 a n=1 Tax=Orchesella cincta TaxID=48709 RepID=A0A1D2N9C5_ORCCI|nr:Reticulocyte-binding protein 2 a [Orchesella cincta]
MAFFAKTLPFQNGVVLFLLLALFKVSLGQQNPYLEKTCAVLYSGDRFSSDELTLMDGDQSVNLEEDNRASSGWNTTGSINIANGCKMDICNETYFDGNCHILEQGAYYLSNLTKEFGDNIASASCRCQKECKCSDIFMKRSTCARAYLKGGCRTCHSLYTDLSDSKTYFPDDFVGKVEALRLRRGCTLTLYPEEDFDGEGEIVDSEIVEDYKGEFRSYECVCNDAEYRPRVRPPRPASLPALVDIPDNVDTIIKMLNNKTYAEHPGLLAALKSMKSGRSSKNVYILLLGSTGAGKSSAVNNLLLWIPNISKVSEKKKSSKRTDIHEFRIPVPVDELGVANSELRVIDTPGLVNRAGICLKGLEGLDAFRERITDENYSNCIFVLSHFCSETKATKRKPDVRLSQFKKVIEDYSLFPRPIIITVAENKAKDQELPMVNGFFKLPNNEFYPRNLYEKLELVTKNGGDMMGLGVFRTAFRDSEGFNVSSITFKLVEKGGSKVEYYLRILSNAFFGVEKTQISQLLQQVWDEKVDATLRKQFPDSLHYLQKSLNIRNVNTMEDIPKTTTAILELLTAIKHDEATRALLDKALNIKPPPFQQNPIAGYSYNVFKDTYLPTSPFQLGDLQQTDIGFMVPKILTCKLEPSSTQNFFVFDNQEQYLQHRLHSLGIEGNIPRESFKGTIKPGHNIRSISFKNDSCTLSATREFRHFEFILNERLDYTPEFVNAVKALPVFNEEDHDAVDKWNAFFNEYGTHTVSSVHGGGSIEIELQSDKPFNDDMGQALFDLIKFAEDMSFLVADESENGTSNANKTVFAPGIQHTLSFHGGDSQYHTSDFTKMPIEDASKLLTRWKKSLKFNPAVLTTEMRLKPISQVVKKIGQNYSSEIERATSLLFNSSLKYVPVKKPSRTEAAPGLARDDTPMMTQLLMEQQKSNQRMQELMMDLKKIEQQNEERRQVLEQQRLAWQQEQARLQQEFRMQQMTMQHAAEEKRQEMAAQLEAVRQQQALAREKQQREYMDQVTKAQEAAAARSLALMREIANRPQPSGGGGSCLKKGTKILLSDMTEKSVEELQVGDIVLDKDMNPTRVLGVAYEFLLDQKFYGFDNESFFFTDSHMFVGPSSAGDISLYAKSTNRLFYNNPLLKYLNVNDMDKTERLPLFHRVGERQVSVENVFVTADPVEYPIDTPIYFIQVDSPTGTYFANGYVCRHEIPPVEYWPNTMSILFKLMGTDSFEKLSQLSYTIETVNFLLDVSNKVAATVKQFIESSEWRNAKTERNYKVMTLEDINMEECISKIFSNPTLSTAGVSLYARVGDIIAPYLDSIETEKQVDPSELGRLQHELYQILSQELEKYI